MSISDEADLTFPIVQAGDSDAFLLGEDLTGFFRIPIEQQDSFSIDLEENRHGVLSGSISVPIVESEDDEDGDHVILSTRYVTKMKDMSS